MVFGLLSMIPAVGAGLLWAPIALYFFVTGAVSKGILLVVFGVVVLTAVDNTLRPFLVGRDTGLPGYLVLVTTLGGIASAGGSSRRATRLRAPSASPAASARAAAAISESMSTSLRRRRRTGSRWP